MMRYAPLIVFITILTLVNPTVSNCGPPDTQINETAIEGQFIIEQDQQNIPKSNHFTENKGQWSNELEFVGDIQGGRVGLGNNKIFFDLHYREINQDNCIDEAESYIDGHVFIYEFIGANDIEPEGRGEIEQRNNYFIGNDPSEWATQVPNFQRILYEDLYDKIDLLIYYNNGDLKYDFILHPGSDPKDIQIEIHGHDEIEIMDDGVQLSASNGFRLNDNNLFAYYEDSKERIDVKWEFLDINIISYDIGVFNPSKTIVIDPLIFSTYIGNSGLDMCYGHHSLFVDESGSLYSTGYTSSSSFPTTAGSYDRSFNGNFDIFIFKLNNDGSSLVFSTFLGGRNEERGQALILDPDGNLLITGFSLSTDFPVTEGSFDTGHNGQADVILTKFNSNCSKILFSSYIGGEQVDWGQVLRLDEEDNILVSGYTQSSDFPVSNISYDDTFNGNEDCFIVKLNKNGSSVLNGTFIGGSLRDQIEDINIGPDGNVYFTGYTKSTDYPTTPGVFSRTFAGGGTDIIVGKMDSNLTSLIISTMIGGNSEEFAYNIHIGDDHCPYVAGRSASSNIPTTPGAYDTTPNGGHDALIFKMDCNFSSLMFSTVIGGIDWDEAHSFAIDSQGDLYIAGGAWSDFPTTIDGFDTSFNGGEYDTFIARFNHNASVLEYSTFIGGNGWDSTWNMFVDEVGDVYVVTGTPSSDYPTTMNAYDRTFAGDHDIIAFKLEIRQHYEPKQVHSIDTYSDPSFIDKIDIVDIGETIYIELVGEDGNTTMRDRARVNIASTTSITTPIILPLIETGTNTGIYRGHFKVSHVLEYLENITITSWKDPTKMAVVHVNTPVLIRPYFDQIFWKEDVFMEFHFQNMGYHTTDQWRFNTDANWLEVDEAEHKINGTPDNSMVGIYWININASDGQGNNHWMNISIEVVNRNPSIDTENDLIAYEDEMYYLDYESDDEGVGDTEWKISPSYIEWLDLDPASGVLSGTPTNDDVYDYDINISIDDGNGGFNWTEFTLTVIDTNDPPAILTADITTVDQNQQYYVRYFAEDIDGTYDFVWHLETDASFLSIDNHSGLLTGTPRYDDIGEYFVNVSVEDDRGGKAHNNFTLTVIDVNDEPQWSTVPTDVQIDQGDLFSFDVDALDHDLDDIIMYGISTDPDSDMVIDDETGEIIWTSTLEGLKPTPYYVLNVEVSATDGEEMITHGFTIIVIPNPSPTSTLLGPDDGKRITSEGTLLEWEGNDDGEEPLKYDIFLGMSQTDVSMLESSVLWMEDVQDNSIHTGEVEPGKTYYWTVVPHDIYSSGICTNQVFSFSVNIPPFIEDFTVPGANIGVEWRLSLMGSDLNNDDLEFSIVEGPAGMEIFNEMITWMPALSQVGTHTVNVSLTDGYETISTEFDVIVPEEEIIDTPDDKGSPIGFIIAIMIVVLLLIAAGVGIFLYMKNKGKEEPPEEIIDENPPEDTGPSEEEKQAYDQLYGQN